MAALISRMAFKTVVSRRDAGRDAFLEFFDIKPDFDFHFRLPRFVQLLLPREL